MLKLALIFASVFIAPGFAKTEPDSGPSPTPSPTRRLPYWGESARRFTGESDSVRSKAIENLKKIPNLKIELKKALGSAEHFLALDVISVLRMRSMIPELIKFSERDHTGYSYHVINSLFEEKDEETVRALYLERLDSKKSSSAAKMAMLDALARLGVSLGDERVSRLLKDESPEVRSTTLSLIRTELVLRNVQRNLPALEVTVNDSAFQIRIQTLYLVSELAPSFRRANLTRINSVLERCARDSVPQVKVLCESVRKGVVE